MINGSVSSGTQHAIYSNNDRVLVQVWDDNGHTLSMYLEAKPYGSEFECRYFYPPEHPCQSEQIFKGYMDKGDITLGVNEEWNV